MKFKILTVLQIVIVLMLLGCNSNQHKNNSTLKTPIDKKVDSLLDIMTLEEKLGQMNQYNGF